MSDTLDTPTSQGTDAEVRPGDTPNQPQDEAGPRRDEEISDEESSEDQSSETRLLEEGELAADYLEELLDILDLDGDIDLDVENGRASVSIPAEGGGRDLRRLVGPDGEVLEALQELTRLAVQTRTGDRSRLMLDIAGFRANRRRELETLATGAVERVRTDGEPLKLDPMSPFERKVVHDVVAEAGLRSESEGDGAGRRVVIYPAAS